ncbi:MAG TPA: hypothetical protein EYO40_06860 [Phycisphaerales bacterium]|nr:hypothetical protein [Phycisphaerales bacterium]
MSTNNKPRLVIIISDGPMLVGTPEQVANRPAIHIPVDFPPIPLATIATTIATGVNPVVHGIVTAVTVDGETFQIRDTVASDRCFQAFWTQSGLHTKLINWPATEGDSDVTSYEHSDVFAKAKECLEADVIGMVLPSNVREQSTPDSVREQQQELETFLSSLTHSTRVLLVHKRTNNGGHIPNARLSLCATFLVDGCAHELRRSSYLEVMGGAMYVLSGVSCPMGVKLPQWHFIKALVDCLETRVFPINPKNEETDWLQLIDKIAESKNEESIALLNQRFTTLVSVSFKKKLWKELEYNSECLIQLKGEPFERWLKILALHQQDKKIELAAAAEDLCDFYPNKLISRIAKSLLLYEAKPDEALELLKDIDPTKIAVWHALGTFGRMCFCIGLEEKGVEAIQLALHKQIVIPADRVHLALHYVNKGDFESALKSLGRIGIVGEITWQELRLRILVALQLTDQAKQVAGNILQIKPAHQQALDVLG